MMMAIALAEIPTPSVSTPRFVLAALQVIERSLKAKNNRSEMGNEWHTVSFFFVNKFFIGTHHHYESPTTKASIRANPLLTAMDSSKADDSHRMRTYRTWIENSSGIHRIGRNDQYNFAISPMHDRWV